MAKEQADSRFVVFTDPVYGIRALAKCLLTYSRLHEGKSTDIDTVREVINRWAPPVENDTGAYVDAVAKEVCVHPDEPIKIDDPDTLERLVRAIIRHENGRVIYSDAEIVSGIDKALA
jgi:uncharacterized protein (DUF169 family)